MDNVNEAGLTEEQQADIQDTTSRLMKELEAKAVVISVVCQEGAVVAIQSKGIEAIKTSRDILEDKFEQVISKEEISSEDRTHRSDSKRAASMVSKTFSNDIVSHKDMADYIRAISDFNFLIEPFIIAGRVLNTQKEFDEMMVGIIPMVLEAAETMRNSKMNMKELEEYFENAMEKLGFFDMLKAVHDKKKSELKVSRKENKKDSFMLHDGPTTIQ